MNQYESESFTWCVQKQAVLQPWPFYCWYNLFGWCCNSTFTQSIPVHRNKHQLLGTVSIHTLSRSFQCLQFQQTGIFADGDGFKLLKLAHVRLQTPSSHTQQRQSTESSVLSGLSESSTKALLVMRLVKWQLLHEHQRYAWAKWTTPKTWSAFLKKNHISVFLWYIIYTLCKNI